MKIVLKEYVKIIVNLFCAMLICLGFYNIFVNLMHQSYIDQESIVTISDNNYVNFQKNIQTIKSNASGYSYNSNKYIYDSTTMDKLSNGIKLCSEALSSEKGLAQYKNGDRLKPFEVYQLNANFINEIVNQCWIYGFSFINLSEHNYVGYLKDVFPVYNRIVDLMIEDSNYVKLELMNNGSYHYSTSITKSTIRNEMLSQYNMIIRNYHTFSNIIREISEFMIKGDVRNDKGI